MKTGPAGIALIKSFESRALHAYPDPATGGDPWTNGYGHTGEDVIPGQTIDEAQAERWLAADLFRFERAVDSVGPLTQNQYDACISLAYNIGVANFDHSTLVRMLQNGDTAGAAGQFERWNKAGGKVMAGLTRRRAAERALFES